MHKYGSILMPVDEISDANPVSNTPPEMAPGNFFDAKIRRNSTIDVEKEAAKRYLLLFITSIFYFIIIILY